VILPIFSTSVKRCVPVWLVISARVVTWRNSQQLFRIWSCLILYLACCRSSMMWVLFCCRAGIAHGYSNTICPWILCKDSRRLAIQHWGVHGNNGAVYSRTGVRIPACIWYVLMAASMRFPRYVFVQRCLIRWIIFWRPCSVLR